MPGNRAVPALILAAALAAGCAGGQVVLYEASDLGPRLPRKVAVLPFGNHTVSLKGPERLRPLVIRGVRDAGFEVPEAEGVDQALRGIGITDGGQLGAVKPDELGRTLGVDGLLYGVLEDFVNQNLGAVRRRVVRLNLRLVAAESGEKLWEGVGTGQSTDVALDQKAIERAFIEGMAVQALETALGTPLQREAEAAVRELFGRFPRRR
ncbi:MAG: hypothetical protein A2X36_08500 [Elusimicrobia bacterium GWA2_69_24]|nr:MAG: hypothetical protein A2X36_08500 [Elusimicrobia bacterium GWA2_69_24]HBL16958.1 hypothetical protein [Elusimicrobiota bacterium]